MADEVSGGEVGYEWEEVPEEMMFLLTRNKQYLGVSIFYNPHENAWMSNNVKMDPQPNRQQAKAMALWAYRTEEQR